MSCSKEEIERKRLAALQKRQSKITSQSSPAKNYLVPSTSTQYPGAVKHYNGHKAYQPYGARNVENEFSSAKVVSGTIYLISEEKFEVNPSEFCTPLINIFKTIPSRNYDPKSKLWNFSIDDYKLLMSKVTPLAPHVVLGPLPPYVLKILQERPTDPNTIDLSPIESTLRNKLMPFQQDGVRFGVSRRGRCLLADDMGLGKTFQALAIASYYRHDWPMLIVTTSSMRETWQSKIHELLPSVPMMNIVTLSSGKDAQIVADRQTEVVIVSYKMTSLYSDLLCSKKFGVVIIDECHNVKSRKAQCTVSLRAASSRAARMLLLSGTPALSRPAELYSQLDLIHPKLFTSYTEYGKRYCAGKMTNFGWDMSGQSNLTELQIILQRKFLIRRTKEEVLTSLEEKTRETVLLDESLLQFDREDQSKLTQLAASCKSSPDKHAALLTYFSETAKIKIPAVCKYIKGMVREETKEKFLVFAHHKNMIEAVCATLDEEQVSYICIVGSTPAHTRAELVEVFQHREACRGAVLSLTAAGAGLTLTAAGLVLFAELHWNPGVLSQAESRAHRLGRAGAVRARYLLAPSTADGLMWPLLAAKLAVLNDAGLSRDTYEDATVQHQESKNLVTQYFKVNRNEYIPGTNVRRSAVGENRTDVETLESCDGIDKTFLENDEDDDLLADLDL